MFLLLLLFEVFMSFRAGFIVGSSYIIPALDNHVFTVLKRDLAFLRTDSPLYPSLKISVVGHLEYFAIRDGSLVVVTTALQIHRSVTF